MCWLHASRRLLPHAVSQEIVENMEGVVVDANLVKRKMDLIHDNSVGAEVENGKESLTAAESAVLREVEKSESSSTSNLHRSTTKEKKVVPASSQ